MTTAINAPEGANAPALPIAWHKLSEMWSATRAERAIVGSYELIAFDIPPTGSHPRIIAWEMHTGPKFTTGVAGAPADNFDAAKVAAEQEARRLLTDAPPEPFTNGADSRVIPACVNGMPKRGRNPGLHPDAELLFAWDGLQAAATAYQVADDGETNRYCEMVDAIGVRIEAYRPKTLEGVAIQLRYLLTKYIDADCGWSVLVFGNDPDRDFHDIIDNDPHASMLWSMIQPGDRLVDRIARHALAQHAKGTDRSSAPST